MIRGAIDLAASDMIGGWIYSDAFGVRSLPVLAYVDDICVGAGKVTEFRRDLAEAGLGDGYLGFKFRISLKSPEDRRRVVVKLEGSDALLVQQGSKIAAGDAAAASPPRRLPTRRISCLLWMRDRGWLNQAEYDFLTLIDQAGVYDRMLGNAKLGKAKGAEAEPAAIVADLLGLYHMETVQLQQERIDAVSDLPGFLRSRESRDGADFIVALWAEGNARIGVLEGSHLARSGRADEPSAADVVSYRLSPDRLLFLNARCHTEARSLAPKDGIHVFCAQPSEG